MVARLRRKALHLLCIGLLALANSAWATGFRCRGTGCLSFARFSPGWHSPPLTARRRKPPTRWPTNICPVPGVTGVPHPYRCSWGDTGA
jgi:hypothetical protein